MIELWAVCSTFSVVILMILLIVVMIQLDEQAIGYVLGDVTWMIVWFTWCCVSSLWLVQCGYWVAYCVQ